jgi:hypothetical protein
VFGPARDWDWRPDAEGKTCAYVAADLFGLGMQGPGGARAEGRMAPAALVYNPGVPGQARYLSGLNRRAGGAGRAAPAAGGPGRHGPGGALDRAQRRRGRDRGLPAGALPAGRGGDPELLTRHRAPGRLGPGAAPDGRRGGGATAGRVVPPAQARGRGGRAGRLEGVDQAGWSAAPREAHRERAGYLRNQAHRMDYPSYVAKGWQIGSGPVEAACKLVGPRLKGGGDAVGRARGGYRLPPAGAVPQRDRSVGCLLAAVKGGLTARATFHRL